MNRMPFSRTLIALATGSVLLTGAAQATLIDLSDNSFTAVTHGLAGPIIAFTETAGAVQFTFQRLAGQFRQVGTWSNGTTGAAGPWALDLGGGAGSVTAFTLTPSADVLLDSFNGLAQRFNTNPQFDVTGTGVNSAGNSFSVAGFLASTAPATDAFVAGPLALIAGNSYTFTVTNPGPATRGYITGLNFRSPNAGGGGNSGGGGQAAVPSAPLALLFLSGLALLAGVRRRLRG